ncbi:MAG: peptidylprolyl isomerase [Anaerolineae bacterium]|nr:peptidylprolyl isomerase [Anaerolineae bacterium]MDQ7033474.1 peptidylprolyl isomerase [Anaerolineae bacterium]
MAKQYSGYPEMVIDLAKTYVAVIKTNKGTINVNLFADRAPKTVNNFVFLARDKFFDGITFHRVLADFMIQGGDPTGTGRGGAGYRWDDEASALNIKHERGSLSMANAGSNTNGSQFFITHIVTDWLDGKHAVFGKVVGDDDQKVVDSIEERDVIESIEIVES